MTVRMSAAYLAASLMLVFSGNAIADERPATKAEIEKIAVGKTVNGRLKYTTKGRYTFAGGNPGRYTISAGKVCVKFDDGRSRCDRIVTSDGRTFNMVTSDGSRYPYKS